MNSQSNIKKVIFTFFFILTILLSINFLPLTVSADLKQPVIKTNSLDKQPNKQTIKDSVNLEKSFVQNKANSNASSNNTVFSFSTLSPVVYQNGIPQAWTSTSIFADNGFLTVGGDGLVFSRHGNFQAPYLTKSGFFTGSAWDGNNFLVVGQKYFPNTGVLMGLYNPINNSFMGKSFLFDSSLSINATLFQTVWNGTSFIIMGSHSTNPSILMLYSYKPGNNTLNNLSNLLTPDFYDWNFINSVQMLATPNGIFLLIHGSSGLKFGLLSGSSFTDLTSSLPFSDSISSMNNDISSVQNTMYWLNQTLYIADSFSNSTIIIYTYNPVTNITQYFYHQFDGITAFVGTMTYLDGYFIISGYNTSNNFPLMYAFQTDGALINLSNLSSSLNQNSNWIISSASDLNSNVYITYGRYPYVYYGLLNITGITETHYYVIFKETGLRLYDFWSISLAGWTKNLTINQIIFSVPPGDYLFTAGNNPLYKVIPQFSWVSVINSNITININLVINETKILYYISFKEIGLPQPVYWTVTLNLYQKSEFVDTIVFAEVSGNYTYQIYPVSGYNINPNHGNVTINYQNVSITILYKLNNLTNTSKTITVSASGFDLIAILLGISIYIFEKRKNSIE